VSAIGDDNVAEFASGRKALTCFAILKAFNTKLDIAKAGQQTATAKEVLFDILRLDLQNLARTVRGPISILPLHLELGKTRCEMSNLAKLSTSTTNNQPPATLAWIPTDKIRPNILTMAGF
jgi:hypothetical protein